jgi:hypothetical protein
MVEWTRGEEGEIDKRERVKGRRGKEMGKRKGRGGRK